MSIGECLRIVNPTSGSQCSVKYNRFNAGYLIITVPSSTGGATITDNYIADGFSFEGGSTAYLYFSANYIKRNQSAKSLVKNTLRTMLIDETVYTTVTTI